MTRDQIKMFQYTPIAKLIEMAEDLRRGADTAECDFLAFLVLLERHASWAEMGDATFANFLDRTGLTTPKRFERFKEAKNELDEALIEQIGVKAAMQLMRVPDEKKREQAKLELSAVAAERRLPLSEQQARHLIQPHLPHKGPGAYGRKLLAEQLERENRALRDRVVELEGVVARYRERYGDVPEAAAKTRGKRVARKPVGNTPESLA